MAFGLELTETDIIVNYAGSLLLKKFVGLKFQVVIVIPRRKEAQQVLQEFQHRTCKVYWRDLNVRSIENQLT